MKLSPESQTNWEAVKRRYDENAPIPFDDDDRAEGLYDPNNETEVDEFFRHASVIYPDGRARKLCAKEQVSLELSEDVLAYYRAKGADWQAAIDEALRRSMSA
jgi:uncharacterized protein (DUF4415 family)